MGRLSVTPAVGSGELATGQRTAFEMRNKTNAWRTTCSSPPALISGVEAENRENAAPFPC